MGDAMIDQIEEIYYPVLAAFGVPVNAVAIVILLRGKCGLSTCITFYLVGMAVTDLLVVISDPILWAIAGIYLSDSFLRITPICAFLNVLAMAMTVVAVWYTVTFTIDRFVAICCENLKTKYCTMKTAAVILGTVGLLGCLEALPSYFVYGPARIVDNVPWGCVNKPDIFTYPAWSAYVLLHYTLTPCLPFFLILILNVLTVRRILVTGRVRKRLRGVSNDPNHKDTEMESRRKPSILLFSISGTFIILWMPRFVFHLYWQITDFQHYSLFANHTAQMLQLLSSCTNTCIYTMTQTRFREELTNAVKFPFTLIANLLNHKNKTKFVTD